MPNQFQIISRKRVFSMVVPRLQWPQLPAWMSLTGSKKRALEEDDTQGEEERMEVVDKAMRQVGQQERKGEEPAVKRSKPTPPCPQCRAGVPGHWGHLRQA